jgi:hypothetical protein
MSFHAAFNAWATQLRARADEYEALGLTGKQAADWANRGFTPGEAKMWLDAGYSPALAAGRADNFMEVADLAVMTPAELAQVTAAAEAGVPVQMGTPDGRITRVSAHRVPERLAAGYTLTADED